jgi:large subunit ribosomal protein L25
MAATKSETTKLKIAPRDVAGGSRAARRLRREGQVPGVVYGGGQDAVAFTVDERELRHALASVGAVVELELEGKRTSAILKDAQRSPVRGETLHVDFLRVRLDVAIQAPVALEFVGGDDAPGVKEGGVLEHVVREVTVEALPTDIPESIEVDVSQMQVNDTLTVADATATAAVTIVDDPETVVATLTPPRLQVEAEEELEQETGVVGEGAGEAEGAEAEAGAGEAPAGAGDASSE